MALSCVYRVGQSFGMAHVVDVLVGADNEKVRARSHDRLSTYGIGAQVSREHWHSLLRQLIHRGYLTQDIARYSVLGLTAKARPLLRGEETLILARPRARVPVAKRRRSTGGARGDALVLSDKGETLFEELRSLRKRLAMEQGVPAYVVFSDATLAEMSARRPGTLAELLTVGGVGQTKLERYGQAFLDVIHTQDGGEDERPQSPAAEPPGGASQR
jgi:ATP-dependent DNA helicase RecQ